MLLNIRTTLPLNNGLPMICIGSSGVNGRYLKTSFVSPLGPGKAKTLLPPTVLDIKNRAHVVLLVTATAS